MAHLTCLREDEMAHLICLREDEVAPLLLVVLRACATRASTHLGDDGVALRRLQMATQRRLVHADVRHPVFLWGKETGASVKIRFGQS